MTIPCQTFIKRQVYCILKLWKWIPDVYHVFACTSHAVMDLFLALISLNKNQRMHHRNNRYRMRILRSFLSKKFVPTKWRIYKGILVGPRLLRQGISRGCSECEYVVRKRCKFFLLSILYIETMKVNTRCLSRIWMHISWICFWH
jgi:hypothetical protein